MLTPGPCLQKHQLGALRVCALQADRQLAEYLSKQLRERCAENREKVTVVPPRRVEDYKNTHPRWRDPLEVGRELKVDYVIYLEINSMSLYEKGSSNLMYRGRTNVSVSLVDVNHPDENPEQTEVTAEYPSEARGPIDLKGRRLQPGVQPRDSSFTGGIRPDPGLDHVRLRRPERPRGSSPGCNPGSKGVQ